MSNQYAVVVIASGLVENVILLADPAEWPVPEGREIIASASAGIGNTWNGASFIAPPIPPPSTAGLVVAAFAAGCRVISSGTPALNATYGIQPQDEITLTGLQAAISAGQPWPGYLRDVGGIKHVMTAAQFTAIADAILGYIAGIDAYAHGEIQTAPAQPVTIA